MCSIAVLAVVGAGCGSDASTAQADGTGGSAAVAGAEVVDGPLDADERCYVEDADEPTGVALIEGAVGCAGSGQPANPLAAVGSRFTAGSMIVTYRGGGYLRELSDNPDNPLRVQALAVFDVELPGAEHAWFTSTGLREVSIIGQGVGDDGSTRQMGACGVWPNASSRLIGAGQGFAVPIESSDVLTVAYCGSIAAPEPWLAGDPYVSFQAAIGEGQTFANVALRDQDSDDRAFADVAETIRLLAATADVDADELGLADLRSRFTALTDGAAIVTVERFDGGGGLGASDATSEGDGDPLPGAGSDVEGDGELPRDDDIPDASGPGDASGGAFDEPDEPDAPEPPVVTDAGTSDPTGLTRSQPIDAPGPLEAVQVLLADEHPTPGARFLETCRTSQGPCVEWVDDPFDEHYVVAVRLRTLEAGEPSSTVDAYLLLERHAQRWYLLDRHDLDGPDPRPSWLTPELN